MDGPTPGEEADRPAATSVAAGGRDGDRVQPGPTDEPASERPVRAAILELLATSTGSADESQDAIANLQGQRKELLEERKRLTRALRNETRKRKRMLNKSARLSNADLVEVLQIRQNRAVAKAKAAAA